jgi:hypothetical protein
MSALALVLMSTLASAGDRAVSVGLAVPYGTHPGIQASYRQSLTERLYWRTQLAAFTRQDVHADLMPGVAIGLGSAAVPSGWSASSALGVSYLLTSHIQSESISLATGESTLERELRHAIVPTLSGELCYAVRPELGIFGRFSVGRKMPIGAEGSLFVMAELGTRFGLGAR